ncbi:MAG TPA: hypothetical protein VK173_00260 [Lacibacter sp.]|nr:hypothetical protein [Lacibacter sp.]
MKAWFAIICISILPVGTMAQSEKSKTGILPHHAKVQFAGSIGFISVGAGYEFAKKKKLHVDFFYGYVPKKIGGINIHTITGKLTWIPVSLQKGDFKVDLLTAGVLVNYAFGKQYRLSRESLIYYGFPTAVHVAVFAGGALTKNKIGIYYEVGITDKELITFASNLKGGIKFHEIVNIGIGARIKLQ